VSLDKDCCLETFSEAFREGKKKERGRIIKLLEPLAKCDPELCALGCYPEDCSSASYENAIAVIKGEKK
jgi:hypothetical protein